MAKKRSFNLLKIYGYVYIKKGLQVCRPFHYETQT
jgi:hypothetical protein